MSDLVKRLRQDDDLSSRIEAADRIEKLEAALRGMIRLAEAAKMDDRIIVYEARKALDTA